jgi:Zn-dependent peptidase ImmA (M78 family)
VAVHAAAERDAQQLLERLGMTDIPVDPIKVARALGIKVWTSDLEPNVAGVLVKKRQGEPPEIYVNAADHVNRQRFTTAHEVGHFFERARKGDADEPVSFVDYRDDLSAQGTNPSEMYANGFAAALLMPAARVREHWEHDRDATILASRFQVSPEAMRHRLHNLGLQ